MEDVDFDKDNDKEELTMDYEGNKYVGRLRVAKILDTTLIADVHNKSPIKLHV